MTTLTLELPDDLAALLHRRAQDRGEDVNRYAVAALQELLSRSVYEETAAEEAAEIASWWRSLTPEQQAAETEATRRSLEAADAGRTSPAADVYRRIREGAPAVRTERA